MLETFGEPMAVALVGLIGGLALGLASRMGRFCTLGAIEDMLYGGCGTRMRMWGLAIGVAITGSFALMGLGLFDPAASFYLTLAWSPAASIFGGLLFGYGMAIAGNCGFGALARLGGGDIRSLLIVLVMGIFALITMSGPLASLRLRVFPQSTATNLEGIAHTIAGLAGISVPLVGMVIGVATICAVMLNPTFRHDKRSVVWAMVAGVAVVSAWAGTWFVNQYGFAETPVVAHTFTAPVGQTMLYAMLSSGMELSFGVGSVAGVLLGAFIGSQLRGRFKWEACDDPRELRRQILGAALMGIGAVIAVGCSIGQGLSAFSLLAFSAPVTLAAIVAGAALGLRQLIEGFALVK